MGQYLSAPSTEKDSEEGHADQLAYGLAAMQGWRVSMEDAHIAALNLDASNKTSLFSVFDGHGGRAVSQFCAAHLAQEFLASPAYRRGDLAAAITEAYYRLDEMLDSEAGKAELRKFVSDAKPKGANTLFTDMETKLAGSDDPNDELVQPAAGQEDDPLSSSEDPSSTSAGGGGGAPLAARSSSGDGGGGGERDVLEAEAQKAMKKLGSSKDFLESHLMRASVLTPLTGSEEHGHGRAPAGAAPGAGQPPKATAQQQQHGGDTAHNGALAASVEEEEGEEEEQHHAAGMGATAVTVIVQGNRVVVANTGDSRCVLSKRGQARALTLDHKPILFEEAKRIIKAGGFVRDNRINGALNVSRTIGDLDFKRNADLPHTEQMVVATPDIEQFTLEDGDEFLILACDGIWDVLTNQEAVDFVRKRLKAGEGLKDICEQMCDACLAPDLKGLCRGADNMSVVVVLFKKHARLGGFWAALLAACGRGPAYQRSAGETHARR